MSQANGWTGWDATQARTYWAPQVTAGGCVCHHCFHPIAPNDSWDVDHLEPLALGGDKALSNTAPAHSFCNRKAGQSLAQHRRRTRANQSRRIRPW